MITDRERAAFEAGIKLGALYHQWVGTPISPETAGTVETAIEQAVALQPCVEGVRVRLDRSLMEPNLFGYSELRGLMFRVEVTTRVGRAVCRAVLESRDGYPLMDLVSCDEG
ncbi:MAG: dihydroneopterin aldolase family protein [Methanomicrobiales archaeon]|nr:dihydroneopterin aldolase family protein [Methanomicrobiales archaeon]MDI6877147.1 dihydroneopterin aldolase family protein [Methanomicrobiales archaeon]